MTYPLDQMMLTKAQIIKLIQLGYEAGVTDICSSLRSPRLGILGQTLAEHLEETFQEQPHD